MTEIVDTEAGDARCLTRLTPEGRSPLVGKLTGKTRPPLPRSDSAPLSTSSTTGLIGVVLGLPSFVRSAGRLISRRSKSTSEN